MNIKASAPRDRSKDLRDWCGILTLKADHSNEMEREFEEEFLARLYNELRCGNLGFWLAKMRREQKAADKKNGSPKRRAIPA